MKIIIFAGGTGTRLWPLSRIKSPKQFKPLFGEETSLENSYTSIRQKFDPKDIFISTNERFADEFKKFIPDLPEENLILEPMLKDTGPAVAYAMAKIAQRFPNEPVVIRWQNSLIKNAKAFADALDEADQMFLAKEADLIYLGVPSKYPNPSLGYIETGNKIRNTQKAIGLYNFTRFTEKPDLETAVEYQNAGNYAWNPGCYITTPKFILDNIAKTSPEVSKGMQRIQDSFGKQNEHQTTLEEFEKFEKVSIDYLLWEKLNPQTSKVAVLMADYDWHYVSSWKDLKNALVEFHDVNLVHGKNIDLQSKNCVFYNYEEGKTVATFGLKDMIVINTEDVVMIIPQDKNSELKELLKRIKEKGHEELL